jgi:hypothetical protein
VQKNLASAWHPSIESGMNPCYSSGNEQIRGTKMSKKSFLSIAILSALFITGCEMLEDSMDAAKKKNRYVLSLHQIVKYPRAKNMERKIVSFSGEEFWINMNQFFHSRHIKKVKLIPRKDEKDFYDLSLKLDYNGVLKWIQMSMHFRHQEMALLIDGHFYKFYVPDQLAHEEDEWVLLTGPFDKVTANGIKKYTRKNYFFFNPEKQSIMQMFENM